MPVPGFRVVLPLLLCLLVIDPVCSTTSSIKLQMDPQSVEASLQMHTKDIVLRMRMHCNIAYNALFSTVHYCYNGKQYVTVRMWLFYSYLYISMHYIVHKIIKIIFADFLLKLVVCHVF